MDVSLQPPFEPTRIAVLETGIGDRRVAWTVDAIGSIGATDTWGVSVVGGCDRYRRRSIPHFPQAFTLVFRCHPEGLQTFAT